MWIKYWLMWFESLLVFILFKFKKPPSISGIRVVNWCHNVPYCKISDIILLSYCTADWGKIATIIINITNTDKINNIGSFWRSQLTSFELRLADPSASPLSGLLTYNVEYVSLISSPPSTTCQTCLHPGHSGLNKIHTVYDSDAHIRLDRLNIIMHSVEIATVWNAIFGDSGWTLLESFRFGKGVSVTLGQWERDIDWGTGVLTIPAADHDISLIMYE